MCYDVWKKGAEIDVRAMKMCSLKFGSTENKKPKKVTTLEMMYDRYWIVLSCLVVARVKHSLTSELWLSNNILSL